MDIDELNLGIYLDAYRLLILDGTENPSAFCIRSCRKVENKWFRKAEDA